MQKRKVIKLAKRTLVVSLPSDWCRETDIKKGDEVHYQLSPESITFSKKAPDRKKRIRIDADNLGPLLKRTINQVYHDGADEIEVVSTKDETHTQVSEVVNQLTGMHIVEQGQNRILLEDISRPDQDFDKILNRLMLLIKNLMIDGKKAAGNSDEDSRARLERRDLEINRLSNLCLRTLKKDPQGITEDTPRMHAALHLMEQVGDEIKHLLEESKETERSLLEAPLEALTELHDKVYRFMLKHSTDNARVTAEAYEKAAEQITKSGNKGLSPEAISRLENILKKEVSIQELFLHKVEDVHHDTG